MMMAQNQHMFILNVYLIILHFYHDRFRMKKVCWVCFMLVKTFNTKYYCHHIYYYNPFLTPKGYNCMLYKILRIKMTR